MYILVIIVIAETKTKTIKNVTWNKLNVNWNTCQGNISHLHLI